MLVPLRLLQNSKQHVVMQAATDSMEKYLTSSTNHYLFLFVKACLTYTTLAFHDFSRYVDFFVIIVCIRFVYYRETELGFLILLIFWIILLSLSYFILFILHVKTGQKRGTALSLVMTTRKGVH